MNWTFWTRTLPTNPDDCETIDPLLSLYADGMASVEEARRVEMHLPGCAACRESLAWMQATQYALASRPVVSPPADLRARIAHAIAATSAAPVPVSFTMRRAFALRPAYAAVASVVVLCVISYGLTHHPQSGSVSPVKPPQVAAMPSVNTTASHVKPTAGLGVKPHLSPREVPVPRRASVSPNLVARVQPNEAVPEPIVVKTRTQAKPDTKMLADTTPTMAPSEPHIATPGKPNPHRAAPRMMARFRPTASPVETHKLPVVKLEVRPPDAVVAEAPHSQTLTSPALIEKQPVITQDPAPTVAVASDGGSRLQTAESRGMIKVHLAIGAFTHARIFRADSGAALAVRAIDQNKTPSVDINHGGF